MVKINLSRMLGEKKMTQAELARATNIRPTTISELYHELVERVNLKHIEAICKELDCGIEDLLEIVEGEPPTDPKL